LDGFIFYYLNIMQILSLDEINNVCNTIVTRTLNYNEFLHACFQVLFTTGCRCGEVANFRLWSFDGPNMIKWQTIKRGGIRRIAASELPDLFISFIANPPDSGFIASKRNLRSAFDIFSPYQQIFTLDKQISTHLFRHNRIKQLFHAGWSVNDIRIFFAVGADEVPEYYINSVIYVP
jgi:site-specific recombinase XerD